MNNSEKGSKLRNYFYQPSWEEDYFVVAYGDTCTCLVCGYVFGNNKKYNVERHFFRFHEDHNVNFPKASVARQTEIANLKSNPSTATGPSTASPVNVKSVSVPAVATQVVKSDSGSTMMLSYKIAFILGKAMKPFEDGAIVKEAMIAAVNELMHDGEVKNSLMAKLSEVPLSDTTVAKRVNSIAANITDQLTKDFRRCKWFSLQLDEYTGVVDTAQLSVFIRMVFDDWSVREELLSIIPLKGRTTCRDIFKALRDNLVRNGVPLNKLVSVTTDGAPAMVGPRAGLAGLEEAFNKRFQDVKAFEVVCKQLQVPTVVGDTAEIASSIARLFPDIMELTVRAELVRFRNDDTNRWKISCCKAAGNERIWSIVDEEKYENLVSAYMRLLSCFGSSYSSESSSSTMKHVKSRMRSRYTDENLEDFLKISAGSYEPDFQRLGEETQHEDASS